MDLKLINPQRLICHKTKTINKPNRNTYLKLFNCVQIIIIRLEYFKIHNNVHIICITKEYFRNKIRFVKK